MRVRIGRMPESMRLSGGEAEVQGMRLSGLDPAVRRTYGIGDDIAGVAVIGRAVVECQLQSAAHRRRLRSSAGWGWLLI